MKKAIIYLFSFILSFSASGKTLEDIISEFSKAPRAENVNLRKFLFSSLTIANWGSKNFNKKINSMSVLDLESCSRDTKLQFAEQIENLEIEGYEVLMKVKDDDDNVLIMSKSKKGKVKELVIITVNDPTIIRLKGNFTLSDLADVKNEYGGTKRD